MTRPTAFPVSLEAAWREYMTTLAVKNVDKAKQTQIAVKGVLRIMRQG